ncbi:uncharacterized protein LOC143293377 [Babylonia areolata]|uniref:uncharacterized protein LOC143293377 n=1 Tax=Babylonia areolata TaxID=304850 RepID=UPI003FD428C0
MVRDLGSESVGGRHLKAQRCGTGDDTTQRLAIPDGRTRRHDSGAGAENSHCLEFLHRCDLTAGEDSTESSTKEILDTGGLKTIMEATGKGSQVMKMVVGVMVVVWLGVVGGQVRGEMVDMRPYYTLILQKHNDLRKNVTPSASDMTEMMWDAELAKQAEDWASYCRYERPPRRTFDVGSNMFYKRRHVHSWHAVHDAVVKGLDSWSRGQAYYKYSTGCGSACSYVQMIYSSTYRVGCAMNKCPSLAVRSGSEGPTTLFVCFYQPRGRLTSTYPYRAGPPCSSCPMGTYCSEGLCAKDTSVVVARPQPIRQPEIPPTPTPSPRPPTRRPMSSDQLTDEETYFLVQVQNRVRKEAGCQELQWDSKLKEWTDWIINCETNYPGPPYVYTNFYRCPSHMPPYEMVYGWQREGMNTDVALNKGCRTPFDQSKCNHYTNMMQPDVTKMACSACNCGDGTRQLVCIYENDRERYYRGYH